MMCYGDLAPKYLMRDIEARVQHLSSYEIRQEETAPEARLGVAHWFRSMIVRLLKKDPAHV